MTHWLRVKEWSIFFVILEITFLSLDLLVISSSVFDSLWFCSITSESSTLSEETTSSLHFSWTFNVPGCYDIIWYVLFGMKLFQMSVSIWFFDKFFLAYRTNLVISYRYMIHLQYRSLLNSITLFFFCNQCPFNFSCLFRLNTVEKLLPQSLSGHG